MAILGISEFTFGFAFLHEHVNTQWKSTRAAPVLPSLREEAKLGWDVKLPQRGGAYFYQFKLSEFLSYPNASFIADGTYSAPYYLIRLHRSGANRQHRALKRLASRHPRVYYVAPAFPSRDDFDSEFAARRVLRSSRLFPLKDCKNVRGGDQHFITFQTGSRRFRFHSQGEDHESSVLGEDLETWYGEESARWSRIDTEFARALLETVRSAQLDEGRLLTASHPDSEQTRGSSQTSVPVSSDETMALLQEVADVAAGAFGASLLIVGER